MITKAKTRPLRVRINTTIAADLWYELRVEAVKQKTDCGAILDKLIDAYLKNTRQKGGKR